jgi:hypothetical protein
MKKLTPAHSEILKSKLKKKTFCQCLERKYMFVPEVKFAAQYAICHGMVKSKLNFNL